MGLPSKRRTSTSKRQRAAHFALKKIKLENCPKCGKAKIPCRACEFCGTYRGRQILTIKTGRLTAKQKAKERKEKTREKEEAKSAKK